MYSVAGWLDYVRTRPRGAAAVRTFTVPRNVIFLGFTSLFTDISSEMVVSILPIYLVTFLGLTPLQFGIIDGLYLGVSGVVQLASAVLTDRWRRHREMAAIGYAASTLSRIGLLLTSTWMGVTAALTVDRLGKGMRTAPRDALISLSVPKERLGFAFGVHRAMDAVGAMLGPIVAFAILAMVTNGFDVVFVASLCVAIVGVAVLGFFVENPSEHELDDQPTAARGTLVSALALLKVPAFRHLALTAFLLGGLTISDAFIYLVVQKQTNLTLGAFPLLYVCTSAAYLLFAVPVGRLADRLGRFPVFIGGHILLLVMYGILAGTAGGPWLVVVTLLLLGLYYGATEGVLMALGSAILPAGIRTSGLAILTTALAFSRIAGSALFGWGWTRFGIQATTLGFLLALSTAIVFVVALRPRSDAQ